MIRYLATIAALGSALACSLPAAAQQAEHVVPAYQMADFQQQAEKSCSDDLDHNRFGSYDTLSDCIADKSAKLERAYRAPTATAQAQTGGDPRKRN